MSEATGQAVLTVTRNEKASGVTVDSAVVPGGTAVPGTDYGGPTSGTLNLGADVPSQTIPITLLNPNGCQGSRTVLVQLSTPRGGAVLGAKTATFTIEDDE